MRLSEKFEKAGYFWLSPTPAEKVPGTLKISESGEAELEIIGVFGGLKKSFNDDPNINRINGVIEKEGLVTLDKCFYRERNISFGGISRSIIYVNRVFVGVQYEDGEAIEFSGFKFSIEGFDEWLSISGIKVEHDWESKSALIDFHPPEEIRIKLTNDIDLLFTFEWTVPSFGNITEAKITQKAYMKLESKKLLPINDFISIAFNLNNFFCFATDETVTIDAIIATSYNLKHKVGDDREFEVPIKIFYPSLPFSKTVPKVQWHSMLFRYGNIADNLRDILVKWLDAYELIEPALNLYFASKSGAHKYIDGKFLSLAQGIETFHRRTSNETVMSDNKFIDLTKELLEACPQSQREWLQGKLKYGNEIPLRMRLKKMIEPFKSYFGSGKDPKSLINKIVNTRNYLTHYDNKLKDKACFGIELWETCNKMEALFQLHFLKTVGFSEPTIHSIVKNNLQLAQKLNKSNKAN